MFMFTCTLVSRDSQISFEESKYIFLWIFEKLTGRMLKYAFFLFLQQKNMFMFSQDTKVVSSFENNECQADLVNLTRWRFGTYCFHYLLKFEKLPLLCFILRS